MTEPTFLVSTWADGLFSFTAGTSRRELAAQPVRGLAPDGHGRALAIVGPHALARRERDGEWTTLATSPFELSCCMAVGDVIFVGTDDARLLRLNPPNALDPVEGFDRVPGRPTWFAGSAVVNGRRLGPPLGIRSVAATADGRVLFANVHVGGCPRSTDGGQSWQPTLDIQSDVHEVRAHPADPELVAAASAVGLWLSRDAGASWSLETAGLHDPHCYAVAFAGPDLVVSASTDFFSGTGQLYRRPGRPVGVLTSIGDGRPGWLTGFVDTGCMATRGAAVAVADRGGHLYASADFGRTWSRAGTGLAAPSGVMIV